MTEPTDAVYLAAGRGSEAAAEGAHGLHVFAFEGKFYQIDGYTVTTWAIMAILIAVAALATRRISKVPRGGQTVFEMVFGGLEGWLAGFIGSKEKARQYLPLLGTFFLFILLSNYSGLLPGAGSPSFKPPTSVWGTTLGLALVTVASVQVLGVKEKGLKGYLKGFLQPSPLMLPFNILEQFVQPFSLSLRLYGNIFAEEILLVMIAGLVPLFVPIPIMGLALLFSTIQAVVFTTLSAIYIGHATHSHDQPHGHPPGPGAAEHARAPAAAHGHD